MATQLLRVTAPEVLVRSQPRRQTQFIVRGVRLVFGQILEVETASRTEADGFVWYEHAQHPGWWSAVQPVGGAAFMTPYTPPTDAGDTSTSTGGGTGANAARVTFKMATERVNIRSAPGGALIPNQALWYGSLVDFRLNSRVDANGFFWWEQADKPGWWSASGSNDGKQVFMLPVSAEERATSITRLEIPWVSQLDQNAPTSLDCGPSCVLMLLRYYGRAPDTLRVRDLARIYPSYTTHTQLQDLARRYGQTLTPFNIPATAATLLALQDHLRAGRPVILLVRYRNLGFTNPMLRNQNFDHWIVVSGFDGSTFFLHDPLWLSWDRGTFLRVTHDRLLNAVQTTISARNTLYGVV